MRMHFRRWRFREGNAEIIVDNAWSLTGWAQERLVVNGETTSETSGWWRVQQSFSEPWLTRVGETELKVSLTAAINTVIAAVELDGRSLEPEQDVTFDWSGPRRSWPPLGDEDMRAVARNYRARLTSRAS